MTNYQKLLALKESLNDTHKELIRLEEQKRSLVQELKSNPDVKNVALYEYYVSHYRDLHNYFDRPATILMVEHPDTEFDSYMVIYFIEGQYPEGFIPDPGDGIEEPEPFDDGDDYVNHLAEQEDENEEQYDEGDYYSEADT